MKSLHETVRDAETQYTSGNVSLGKYVDWSMYETVETIDAYLNSKHISGDKDALGRDKPFFNIVSAAVNIWYRATDIDRKNIRIMPDGQSSVAFAFIATVLLQRWMKKARFGVFLNEWGRALSRYGSAVVKFVERDGTLTASVVPWNRLVPDPVDFEALPRIERLYKTAGQLKEMATPGHPNYAGYDMDTVNSLLLALDNRKTSDGSPQDNKPYFIEFFEVHGLLPTFFLDDEPEEPEDEKDITYSQQMHVIASVETKDGMEDFTLFKGKEKQDVYLKTDLIKEDGRTLSIGAVESLFDAQWMTNHTQKNVKDYLDFASKIILQTADKQFTGRNVLSSIETGDIMINSTADQPLTMVNTTKGDISALQNFGQQWVNLSRELTSTPDAVRGNTLPSGTPYSLAAYSGEQAISLFEIMTENKGLAIEDMMREFIIPHLKKQMDNKDEVAAILDEQGIAEIDAMFVPKEAIRRYNDKVKKELLKDDPDMSVLTPFDPATEEAAVRKDLGQLGNKRFFKPDELDEKTWKEALKDFEWTATVEVTSENTDKQAVLTTLATVLQSIASNPAILQDPNARMVFNQILTETGRISPMQLSATAAQTPPTPTVAPPAADLEALTPTGNGQT